jgi:hypothetical protein
MNPRRGNEMTRFLPEGGGSAGAPSIDAIAQALGIDRDRLAPRPTFVPAFNGGTFANNARRVCVGPRYSQFFAQNYPALSRIAQARGVDVSLPLGLSALESGWGDSRMNRKQNTPFGATPNGTKGVRYDSIDSAWENWDRQWGPRIQGTGSDQAAFVRELLKDNRKVVGGTDQRGPYNTLDKRTNGNPYWLPKTLSSIAGVRKRLPIWLASGC